MSNDSTHVKRPRTLFDDATRRWILGGLAAHMHQWLRSLAPGSTRFRGWELAGTLDPESPDPTRFRPPPEWLSPDLLMKSMCAWYAGGLQDALVSSGAVPLARLRLSEDGEMITYSGADVTLQVGRTDKVEGQLTSVAYFVVVDQAGPYPLTEAASIQVTSASFPARAAAAVPIADLESYDGFDLSAIQLASYRGFLYTLSNFAGEAFVHLYC